MFAYCFLWLFDITLSVHFENCDLRTFETDRNRDPAAGNGERNALPGTVPLELLKLFRQFGEFVQNCDLTALSKQEQKTLTDYMELRKKWNDIIYDPQVVAEEKIETYKACQILDNPVRTILEKLFNSQYSEEYAAFKEMNDKLKQIFHNDARTMIRANIHITNEKGEKEEVIHQY